MSLPQASNPFGTEPVEEIHLEASPLVQVLTQVRFPRLSAFTETFPAFVAKIAADYPLKDEQLEVQLLVTPDGAVQRPNDNRAWLLRSEDGTWQATVTEVSLALQTTSYSTRTEFCARFEQLLSAFADTVNPPFVERLGIRYTNRIDSDELADLPLLVRREALGILGTALGDRAQVLHHLSDTLFQVDDRFALVRWGQLPPNATFDPAVPATPAPSWVLDIDSFTSEKVGFSASVLTGRLRDLADQAHKIFRWTVTEEFIERRRKAS